MSTLKQGLPYRLLWAAFALVFSGFALSDFAGSGHYHAAITSAGWALLSASWFMQPVIATAKPNELFRSSTQHAVGPAGLRAIATFGGLLCIAAGLVLKFSSGA